MNDRRNCLGLLLGLALAGALVGCTQAEDPLESLIARHVEARGGIERLEAIQTLRMSGRANAGPSREALVTREVRPPGRIRTEFAFQGVTAVYACDGSRCWSVAPLSGIFEPELMSELDTSAAITQSDLLGPLVNWEAKGHSVELLGKEKIDGRETFKLKVTLSSGAVQTYYLDAESALLVRRESTRTLGGRTIEVETTFSDFRPVGGVVFPHAIRSGAKGRYDFLEVIVEEAEFNPPLDDSRFEMPD
jgi:outer membrane lipoprotein-sorting protein